MTRAAFASYLLDFYGHGGIWTRADDPFHVPMTRDEAERVTDMLRRGKTFEGDSFDRERARDLVLSWRVEASRDAKGDVH